ncbi:protein artichoke-like [Bacillus rossius redtenbacheri]|uniref:protein artichoke-like n=1 Tax=Bacillus rossius redtenbacheri TaxID=93214 RepID=UPI002FDE9A74
MGTVGAKRGRKGNGIKSRSVAGEARTRNWPEVVQQLSGAPGEAVAPPSPGRKKGKKVRDSTPSPDQQHVARRRGAEGGGADIARARDDVMRAQLPALVALVALAAAVRGNCPPEGDILPCRCTMREEELQIWCSHSDLTKVLAGLQAVGSGLDRPVDELILENNYLPSLPGAAFSPLRVARLMLRDNGLERVASSWLAGLEDSLLELFVVEPQLRSPPPDSVEQLRGLEALTLHAGAMRRPPRLSGLRRLRYVQLRSPALAELPPLAFRALGALEQLHVVHSPRVARLEAGLLQDLPRLQLLNVSHCGLAWLHPRALARLPALAHLALPHNRLLDAGMVGRAARDLPALATLDLRGNLVERLGEASFVDLPALAELRLAGNRILEVARGAFHRVPRLRTLDLSHNFVRRVHPESFFQHSDGGLEELRLVDNALDHVGSLRALLDALPRLRYLDVSHNFLEEIPSGALRGHPTLESLQLDHNRLQRVQREAFMAMPALRELSMRNNSLSDYADGPLWNLPGLKGLDLSYNYFRRLDQRLLANLPSLRRLDLSGNALALVDPAAFQHTPSLEHVNLSRNAIASLHPATFRQLGGLYELDAGHNRLRELVPGLPRGLEYLHLARNRIAALPHPPSPDLHLPQLKMLDLTANGLARLPPGALAALAQLRDLRLAGNSLERVEEGALAGLARLERLDLRDNRLRDLHELALRDLRRLRRLWLRGNRLEALRDGLLRGNVFLEQLDLGLNRLAFVEAHAFDGNRELVELDASRNSLDTLPGALRGLAALQLLELSRNSVRALDAEVLASLTSLAELRLGRNKLRRLPEGVIARMPSLQLLDLHGNELEAVSAGAVSDLPQLRAVRLDGNRLAELPERAFSRLPELRSAELQRNRLARVAERAFDGAPQLLLLNLSSNLLPGLEEAGLRELRSLEVLDLSHNRVARMAGDSLRGMEWLVELKMDNNNLCSIQGLPFDEMPRLRVLSLRNNSMRHVSEQTFRRLRGNVAVVDVDGNPLSCSCRMLWLQAWLREASAQGPRCADGTLLREMRLSAQQCEARSDDEPAAPGCGPDPDPDPVVASVPGSSQVSSTWVEVKDATAAPPVGVSPEDSEYFYDEYIEYQYEEGNATNGTMVIQSELPLTIQLTSIAGPVAATTTAATSSHYIPGDTPTLYAGTRQDKNKTAPDQGKQSGQPGAAPNGGGGFTFFGIPLPSISLGGLWGSARNADAKPGGMRFVGARGKVDMFPPSEPRMQSDGFVPMRTGSGGFVPIANPELTRPGYGNSSTRPYSAGDNYNYNYNYTPSSTFPPRPTDVYEETMPTDMMADTPDLQSHKKQPAQHGLSFNLKSTTSTVQPPAPDKFLRKPDIRDPFFRPANKALFDRSNQMADENVKERPPGTVEKQSSSYDNRISAHLDNPSTGSRDASSIQTMESPPPPKYSEMPPFLDAPRPPNLNKNVTITKIDTSLHSNFVHKMLVETQGDANLTGAGYDRPADLEVDWFSKHHKPSTDIVLPESPVTATPAVDRREGARPGEGDSTGRSSGEAPSSLSILLAPGAQQPQFRPTATITKVKAPPQTSLAPAPEPVEEYLRGPQPERLGPTTTSTSSTSSSTGTPARDLSKDWYFRNYNRTNLEPYVGPAVARPDSSGEAPLVSGSLSALLAACSLLLARAP